MCYVGRYWSCSGNLILTSHLFFFSCFGRWQPKPVYQFYISHYLLKTGPETECTILTCFLCIANCYPTAKYAGVGLQLHLNSLADAESGAPAPKEDDIINKHLPLKVFSGHKDEGYAIDWSPLVTGRLVSGVYLILCISQCLSSKMFP